MEVAQPLPGQQHTPTQTSADTSTHSALLSPTLDTTMSPTTHDNNVTATATPTLTKQATLMSETNSENNDSMRGLSQESYLSMGGGVSSGLSDESGHSADDCQGDDAAARRSLRQQSKERAIEHVLQQGKILKISRRLRTRLEYAILKIRRGWSKYTLQEVESLMQPGMSPRITSKRPLAVPTSPRYSSRRRLRKEYPEYEQPSDLLSSRRNHQQQDAMDDILPSGDLQTSLADPTTTAAAAAGGRRYKSRPSFSQFKDSELFLPAKSLMDIATSSPSQSPRLNSGSGFSTFSNQYGIQSPYSSSGSPLYRDSTPVSNWSSLSQPTSPVVTSSSTILSTAVVASLVQQYDDEIKDDGSEAPSETQAARTILLLASSPTRPPPRTLDQGYLNGQAAAAATLAAVRSPSASPVLKHAELTTSLSSLPGLTSGITSYSPMTSSPLVQFQTTAASTPSPDRSPTFADDSPFLVKRGGTKGGSNSSLASDSGKRGSSSSLSASATKHEPTSPSPLSSSSLPILTSSPSVPQETTVRSITPPPAKDNDVDSLAPGEISSVSPPRSTVTTRSSKSAVPPRTPSPRRRSQADATLGVRTPPPSEGKEGVSLRHYNSIATAAAAAATASGGSIAQSIAARRRNSGLTGGSGMDMSDSPAASPNPAGASPRGTVRRRTTAAKEKTSRAPGPSTAGMMRIYTDDSPGLRVDPVVVLVLSLAFIASVFALHIYGKLTKA
ncbi:Protein transport protein Sec61 subunit beta [Mortierella hygrophila]|uniref:Protein transport protein Sec61 subunit beta n=2 Tax=Mortierellaceae TaxID=4854 RepID=A0A9P6K2C5_9FUNG|nr:Protein transport protein Sec61 subunit beta [Mortierella hygrophila]